MLSAYATYKVQEKSAQILETYLQANEKSQAETLQALKEQTNQMNGQSGVMGEQVNQMREQVNQMSAQSAQMNLQARNTRLLTYGVLAVGLASLGLSLISFLHL